MFNAQCLERKWQRFLLLHGDEIGFSEKKGPTVKQAQRFTTYCTTISSASCAALEVEEALRTRRSACPSHGAAHEPAARSHLRASLGGSAAASAAAAAALPSVAAGGAAWLAIGVIGWL